MDSFRGTASAMRGHARAVIATTARVWGLGASPAARRYALREQAQDESVVLADAARFDNARLARTRGCVHPNVAER